MSSEQLKNHLRRNCLGRKNAVKSPELERTLRTERDFDAATKGYPA